MERLDNKYLSDLVRKAQTGSSNALAELYSASSDRVYTYLSCFNKPEEDTLLALKEVYVKIFREIKTLNSPALYMPWSLRICFLYMTEQKEDPEDALERHYGGYDIRRLLSLPVAESQIMIMKYAHNMTDRDIADLLNADRGVVRRCQDLAVKHLKRTDLADEPVKAENAGMQPKKVSASRLTKSQEETILKSVFEECGKKPNSIPIEALSAYAVYRRERFSLQRGILVAAIIIFLLLPICFVLPDYKVSSEGSGERGLPVYTVDLNTVIPVRSVTARLSGHSLPVYEASARKYSIEPTRNGEMTVQVELINTQSVTAECTVTDADCEGPSLIANRIEDGLVILTVKDEGIGVDFRDIYALDREGGYHYPVSWDPESGEVIFEYPDSEWDVYIPDHIGNTLHLAFTFE